MKDALVKAIDEGMWREKRFNQLLTRRVFFPCSASRTETNSMCTWGQCCAL